MRLMFVNCVKQFSNHDCSFIDILLNTIIWPRWDNLWIQKDFGYIIAIGHLKECVLTNGENKKKTL
jgi:hypothetical protein